MRRQLNADPIFAGKCYRTMARELRISPLIVDSARYISKVADSACVSQKTYRRAVEMLDIVKKHSISYGKDPKALATAVLYAACIKENELKVSQAKIGSRREHQCGYIEEKVFRYLKNNTKG